MNESNMGDLEDKLVTKKEFKVLEENMQLLLERTTQIDREKKGQYGTESKGNKNSSRVKL